MSGAIKLRDDFSGDELRRLTAVARDDGQAACCGEIFGDCIEHRKYADGSGHQSDGLEAFGVFCCGPLFMSCQYEGPPDMKKTQKNSSLKALWPSARGRRKGHHEWRGNNILLSWKQPLDLLPWGSYVRANQQDKY